MNRDDAIYVAGHAGLVGSAILRLLRARGFTNLLTRTRAELDLTRQEQVEVFFAENRPAYVFLAAATVGGIGANSRFPAQFIYDNLAIALNVIHSAWRSGVRRLLNLGSSCIYPRLAAQPLREEYLLTGALEASNEAYAVAKIAALKLCRHYNAQYGTSFISLMPTNLYGPNDNFDLESSHVLPALIRKLHIARLLRGGDFARVRKDLNRWGRSLGQEGQTGEQTPEQTPEQTAALLQSHGITAERVTLWGTGTPLREFLHVDDLAEACLLVMESSGQQDPGELLNVGTGQDLPISELALLVREVVGYEGEIRFDPTKPDGTPRKVLEVSGIRRLGWKPGVALREGVAGTYRWYLEASEDRR
jgi:GDP-L-fucose synthase